MLTATYQTKKGNSKTIKGRGTHYTTCTMVRHTFNRHGLECHCDYMIHENGDVTVDTATGRRTVGHGASICRDGTEQ